MGGYYRWAAIAEEAFLNQLSLAIVNFDPPGQVDMKTVLDYRKIYHD